MSDYEHRLRQRLALLYQQLELYRRYPEEFEKALGLKNSEDWLNQALDEVNLIRRKLQEINN